MNIFEIIMLSISLCGDSFSCAVSKGICFKHLTLKHILTISIIFAISQTLMPLIGYYIGNIFSNKIIKISHFIAFLLLSFIGISMIKEEDRIDNDSIKIKDIIILSLSVSIDALIVGVTFSCLNINIIYPLISIFLTTFITSFIGVYIGNKVGNKYNRKALVVGGLILIAIGLKIWLL